MNNEQRAGVAFICLFVTTNKIFVFREEASTPCVGKVDTFIVSLFFAACTLVPLLDGS